MSEDHESSRGQRRSVLDLRLILCETPRLVCMEKPDFARRCLKVLDAPQAQPESPRGTPSSTA